LIALRNVTCHWNSIYETVNAAEEPAVALDNISAVFRPHSLYGIMGVVGSGKSAFLQSLVGELPITTGELRRQYSSLAYTSQDPWILNGSVRENIIMQHPFDEDWYQQVVTACALQEDIRRFAHGDATLLGDKGVQCSGGQRARIGLCRALYRDPQVLILDDPMSAVDTKVGRWIYENAILGLAINRGKCVILASHQLHFLKQATECFLMDAGKISCRGRYADCIEAAHGAPLSATPLVAETVPDTDDGDPSPVEEIPSPESDGTVAICTSSSKAETLKVETKEDRRTGIVQLSTWIDYANAMGGLWVAGLIAFLFASAQTLSLVSMVAIGKWSEQMPDIQDSTNSLSIVIGLVALTSFVAIDRALLTFYFFNKASQRLHDKMTRSVLLSRILFFDTNPSGRILNRFSADVGIADEQLPLTLYDCLVGLTMAAGSAVTAMAVLPVILVCLPPLTWYFVKMRNVFVSTTRELKRLEGLGRSPIFEMIGETLNGIATIRANNGSDYFLQKFEKVHDGHTRAYFCFVGASRWFATRLEYVTFCLMAVGSFSAAVFYDQGELLKISAILLRLMHSYCCSLIHRVV
jgi:ATP-binding cassette, subfamily C (CFTR/MRP), member 4